MLNLRLVLGQSSNTCWMYVVRIHEKIVSQQVCSCESLVLSAGGGGYKIKDDNFMNNLNAIAAL